MTEARSSAREAAVKIVRTLHEAGHTAYLAGGCVRDAWLGLVPKDYDVATDAMPEKVRKLFRRSRYVGESFGVVRVLVLNHPIEVATFRREWGYRDGRRPDHVTFTDAEQDARRRDFTINGLFADPLETDAQTTRPYGKSDRIIDFVAGRADLEAGLIRAIGDPHERFEEDYLRMLRAVRFSARFDFNIETQTQVAIQRLSSRLGHISRERIGQEVHWMLQTTERPPERELNPAAVAAQTMQQLGLDGPVLNETPRQGSVQTLGRLESEADYPTALAAWMVDRHTLDRHEPNRFDRLIHFVKHDAHTTTLRWRKALCLSNEDRQALSDTLLRISNAGQWPTLGIAQRKRLLATPRWEQARLLLRALALGSAVATIERDSSPLLAEGVHPTPLVNGNDLVNMGLQPGPSLGQFLDLVYDAQLEGLVTTREQALAWLAQRSKDQTVESADAQRGSWSPPVTRRGEDEPRGTGVEGRGSGQA